MQHFNLIDENQTIYESLAVMNNNFRTLASCFSGTNAPVADSNTPITPGTLWYNTAENRVYQLDYNNPGKWILSADLNGTATTKEYIDGRIVGHNHDSTYLKLDGTAKDVQFVNGTASTEVIFRSNISDVEGTSSGTVAPSSRLFDKTRREIRTFIDTLGDPDKILKQLKDLLDLINDNQGNLDNLGIDNINGLRTALDGKMPLATTLEDLGGVRGDGATLAGFTGRILFNKTAAIANGGVIAVGREGSSTSLHAVSMWDDGGTNPDAVQIGDNVSRTFINALSPNDAYIAVGGTTRHVIYNKGNIVDLDTDLVARDFMKEAAADLKYLLATGKAADSSLLNGVAEDTAQSNNTIVKRNSVGDIVTRYFRTNAGAGVESDANYFLVQRATGTGGDNYARPVSANNVKGALGIANLPDWSQSDFDSRYVNVTGDSVTGDLHVDGEFSANNFVVRNLPRMQMGDGGVDDEYLILAKRFVGTNLPAMGVAGHFKFHKGSVTEDHAISDVYLILTIDNNHDAIGLFDQYGTPIITSIDAISVNGVQYYAARMRANGGTHTDVWQFEGEVYNAPNDSNFLKRVRLSDADVTFVTQKWRPATAINSFNFVFEGTKSFLRTNGSNTMTGDIAFGADLGVVTNSTGGFKRSGGNRILWDHNNGHVSLSAGSGGGNLYLGYDIGLYKTNQVVLSTNLVTSTATQIIDASNGQLFDEGDRVYSPNNKGQVAFKDESNTWTGNNTFNSGSVFNTPLDVRFDGSSAANTLMTMNGTMSNGDTFYINNAVADNIMAFRRDGVGNYRTQFFGSISVGNDIVWHAGNDGTGSGLDADLIDGLDATSFVRSDQSDTVSARTSWTNTDSIKVPAGTEAQRTSSPEVGDFRYNSDTNSFEGYTDRGWGAIAGGAGRYVYSDTNRTLRAGDAYVFDVTSGALTATLPASGSVGDSVSVGIYSTADNQLTVASSLPIMGKSEDFALKTDYAVITFAYINAALGWKIVNGVGESEAPSAISVEIDAQYDKGTDTFNMNYQPGFVHVYIEGEKLPKADFNAADGSTIKLLTPLKERSWVNIVGYNGFSIQNIKAANVEYDPTGTRLSSNTVQEAITELSRSSGGGSGGMPTFNVVSANTLCEISSGYLVDCTDGPKTMTVPVGAPGNWLSIGDYNGKCSISNPIILTSTANIEGSEDDFYLVNSNAKVFLSYIDSTQGWKIVDGIGEGGNNDVPYEEVIIFNNAAGGNKPSRITLPDGYVWSDFEKIEWSPNNAGTGQIYNSAIVQKEHIAAHPTDFFVQVRYDSPTTAYNVTFKADSATSGTTTYVANSEWGVIKGYTKYKPVLNRGATKIFSGSTAMSTTLYNSASRISLTQSITNFDEIEIVLSGVIAGRVHKFSKTYQVLEVIGDIRLLIHQSQITSTASKQNWWLDCNSSRELFAFGDHGTSWSNVAVTGVYGIKY